MQGFLFPGALSSSFQKQEGKEQYNADEYKKQDIIGAGSLQEIHKDKFSRK